MSVSIEPYGDLGIPHSKNPTKVCSAIRFGRPFIVDFVDFPIKTSI